MEKVSGPFFYRPFGRKCIQWRSILYIFISALIPACAGGMPVEEAKEVSVSMAETETFLPPPRRINDILDVLNEQRKPQTEVAEQFEKQADVPPPENAGPGDLASFYHRRGFAAWERGRHVQALEDLRRALKYADRAGMTEEKLLQHLANVEKTFGNYRRALALLESARETSTNLAMLDSLVFLYAKVGDLENARKAYEEGMKKFSRFRKKVKTSSLFHASYIEATLLETEGKWKEAEPHIRKSMELRTERDESRPVEMINRRLRLTNNLLMQERFLEAEMEARQALSESMARFGKESNSTWKSLDVLVSVVLAQGRVQDAEKLASSQLQILQDARVPSDSYFYSRARMSMGNVLATRGDFVQAMAQFDTGARSLRKNQFDYKIYTLKTLNLILCLVMVDRTDEAMQWIANVFQRYKSQFGEEHYRTAEVLAIQAMAEARKGKEGEALRRFGKAIPILIENAMGEGRDYPRIQRLKVILEAYIALLSRIRGSELERGLGLDATTEAFRIADVCRSRSVQGALSASSARAAVTDPKLSELIRKEQDAHNQVNAAQEVLMDMVSAPQDEQIPKLVNEFRSRMVSLGKDRAILLQEIRRQFPKYSDFVNPESGTVSRVREQLRAGEALVSIYTSRDHTYVWLVPQRGPIRFAAPAIGKQELDQIIMQLRKALDPHPGTLGDIPPLDLKMAYDLYGRLLSPVEEGWKDTKDLIVVAGGSLGQIPFSVLPTAPASLEREKGELFSNYRSVPWLIRKLSLTRLPTVSSFITLRALPEGDARRKAFAGFGDPLFNPAQLAKAESEKGAGAVQLASRGQGLHVRGIRQVEGGDLDSKQGSSSQLGSLTRLPDTGEEIRSICSAIGSDPAEDIYLGRDASEHRVKTMNLSERRIIVFATHALVPGDLDGLDQPALALSAPSVTGDSEDGLLTMQEVLGLKLNADWVVLSACNTGASDGEGAEAASGLGRAFFYAGTRAILVSMWPVETTSAMRLTTGLFRYQKEDKTLNRSRALQKSILDLIDREVLKDEGEGKVVASYAHPFFWAPFIVMGESGG